MDVASTSSMASRRPRKIEDITNEALNFEYSDSVSLRNWLRTARQVRQQAEIYEDEGSLQQAYQLYFRQIYLVLEHLKTHPDARASAENERLLRTAKKDVAVSLSRLEKIKPVVVEEYEIYLKRKDDSDRRRREAEERAAYRNSEQQRGSPPPSPRSSRPPSGSYYDPYSALYYDGRKHPELALQVAHQSRGYTSPASRAAAAAARSKRYSGEDFNLAQDMQNIRLQLEGRGAPQASSRPPLPPRKGSGLSSTSYPSVPSSRPLPTQSSLEAQWQARESGRDGNLQIPSRPDKVPIRSRDQDPVPVPARPPKEGYVEPTSPGWPSNPVMVPPVLPPKAAAAPATNTGSMQALMGPQQQQQQQQQQMFKPSAFLENGIPLRTVFFPPSLRNDFLRAAQANTNKKLETCGIICGFLKNNALFISSLVIPEQTSTSDTCEMTLEGEIALFDWVDGQDLLTLGWIHTHPTQTCFMSSRDLHTHCGYQSMMQESIAVVCAPSIKKANGDTDYGIFRLTEPPGMQCIRKCTDSRVFHPHEVENLYTDCQRPGHVVELEGLAYKVHDLRNK